MILEILYLAWNRLAFTQASFAALVANTDWERVNRLVVYDDGSEDGTAEWLAAAIDDVPAKCEFRQVELRSPPETMAHYLARTDADVFAKCDNDVAMPAGWLGTSLQVLDENPHLDLLGLAAGWTGVTDGPPGWQPSSHIGGVGLIRTRTFRFRPPLGGAGRFGWTEWQHQHVPRRGWITPDLPVVQLDLIPEEPWQSLAASYVEKGWAREWPPYDEASREWWAWIPKPELVSA